MSEPTKIQVLVAAMHQTDASLIEKMHIQTDALVGNQCDRCCDEVYSFDGFCARYRNRTERGVGFNRNETLLHSTGEILIFADDDEVLSDGYAQMVEAAFAAHPDADGLIFNIQTVGTDMGRRVNEKCKRVRYFNALNYGAARLAVRADAIRRENIVFHTCFGGGTRYNSGEDTLFIFAMLRHKLRLYTHPGLLASVDQTSSTWFRGYDKKYLHDKGALFQALSPAFSGLLCLQDLIRHREICRDCGLSLWSAYRVMKAGRRDFQRLQRFEE